MDLESRKHPSRQVTASAGNRSIILHVTACTFRRRRILACNKIHDLIVDAWTHAPEWTVGRYVVMPDHVHLFAAENELEGYPLGQWVAKWKAHVSRLWPFAKDQPIWQRSFWDYQLRNGDSYDVKWLYIRNNPVRHGLVSIRTTGNSKEVLTIFGGMIRRSRNAVPTESASQARQRSMGGVHGLTRD